MKREFLEGLGLDGMCVDSVMKEYGLNVEALKKQIVELETELKTENGRAGGLEAELNTLRGERTELGKSLEALKKEATALEEKLARKNALPRFTRQPEADFSGSLRSDMSGLNYLRPRAN